VESVDVLALVGSVEQADGRGSRTCSSGPSPCWSADSLGV